MLCALILLSAAPIKEVGPWAALWAAPAILFAALLIAWGAESAQYFVAQGFALAILAWLQTLPEFAVEAVLAWKLQTPLLIANLTGALRLLTGFGWPMIYATAAVAHRRATGKPLRRISLDALQGVQVVGLFVPLVYMFFVYWKGSLGVIDAVILIVMYAAYLAFLSHMPPEEADQEKLESIPKKIVGMQRIPRIVSITALFVVGGGLIYFAAEPFLGSLLAISTAVGISSFIFIQWVAPFVSEFPEMASTFYFARTVRGAPMALMNMVSSNINQWTLLAAMLPIVFSISAGKISSIPFDKLQQMELLMTLAQALVGVLLLMNMELLWWEATGLFVLFFVQFLMSAVPAGPGTLRWIAANNHYWIIALYFTWAAFEAIRLILARRQPPAVTGFLQTWKTHILRR